MGAGGSDVQIIYNLGSISPIGHKDGLNIHHFSKCPVTFHLLIVCGLEKGHNIKPLTCSGLSNVPEHLGIRTTEIFHIGQDSEI